MNRGSKPIASEQPEDPTAKQSVSLGDIEETETSLWLHEQLNRIQKLLVEHGADVEMLDAVEYLIEDNNGWINPEIQMRLGSHPDRHGVGSVDRADALLKTLCGIACDAARHPRHVRVSAVVRDRVWDRNPASSGSLGYNNGLWQLVLCPAWYLARHQTPENLLRADRGLRGQGQYRAARRGQIDP